MKTAKKLFAAIMALAMILCMLPATVVASSEQEHKDLAREAVGEGIVLLKNNDALPLTSDNTIAVFGGGQVYTASTSNGYQIGGGGSGWVNMDYTPLGPIDVLRKAAADGRINIYEPLSDAYVDNVSYVPDSAMYDAAAAAADTAVMFITRYSTEGSDISAANFSLSSAETTMLQNLSRRFDKVVVLVNAPSMIATDWSLDGNNYGIDVDALLITYMAGEMGAYGMADILLGDVNPSGKLVDTYAYTLDDYPSTTTFAASSAYQRYTEDIFVGYRYFETFAPDRVVYEFGYGMSYTTFDIETDSVTFDGGNVNVTATVTNTGDVAGKEVVEVYYSSPQIGGDVKLSKAAIELGAYQKTDLIQPGESQTLTVSYPIDSMASFDDLGATGNQSAYVLEPGAYAIRVGSSVKKNVKVAEYTVDELTVVEQLSKLCATNLDQRAVVGYDDEGGIEMQYQNLNAVSFDSPPIDIAANEVTVVEAEDASGIGDNMMREAYSTSNGFFLNGDTWVSVPSANTIIGNLHNSRGQHIYLDLNVASAGTYTLGFVNSNGGSQQTNAEDILTLSLSTDGGSTWAAVPGFSFDSPNTHNSITGTSAQWWNLRYDTADLQGNTYSVELPSGRVIFRLTVTNNAADGYSNTNLDKIAFIPAGMTYTAADVYEYMRGINDAPATYDLNEDHIDGEVIKLQDVADGNATMEELVAQMSLNELISFCSGYTTGVYSGTGSIGTSNRIGEKYGIFSADTADGPAGIRLSTYFATYWPCSTLQACTWNPDLIEEIGETVGKEALKSMVDIWLAPGMNIHRSPRCGRNFEYYSEDPLVSGKSAAALTRGVQSQGPMVTLKHFCANNKEQNRNSSDSRMSERALREIYLKGFEIAVKEADPGCIMTSYNYLNGIETSENYDLLHGILRNEWGWQGLVMTDWGNNSNIVNEVNAGNNVKMSSGDLNQLRTAVQADELSRETLEENAVYVLNTLMRCPDFTINQYRVIDITGVGTDHFDSTEFSRRAYQTRYQSNGNHIHIGYFDQTDVDGDYSYVEYTLNVAKAGDYFITTNYASNSEQTGNSVNVFINGELQEGVIPAPNSGGWNTYAYGELGTFYLPEGIVTFRLQNVGSGQNYLDFYLTAVENTNKLTVAEEEIKIGDDGAVEVTNHLEGLTSFTAVIGGDIDVTSVSSDYSYLYNPRTKEVVVWCDEDEGIPADAVVLTLNYAQPNAGYYVIELDVTDATGANYDWAALTAESGSLTVAPKGDVSVDGGVDNRDLIMIARYLVGLVQFDEMQMELADFNNDGIVNNTDLVLIARYIVSRP